MNNRSLPNFQTFPGTAEATGGERSKEQNVTVPGNVPATFRDRCCNVACIKRGPGRTVTFRMRQWRPIIDRFNLSHTLVQHQTRIYTLAFADQLGRCADDDARRVLLGIQDKGGEK